VNLAFASVLTIVFFTLPIILRLAAARRTDDRPKTLAAFLQSRVETATGT
jgi:hypothetical protein